MRTVAARCGFNRRNWLGLWFLGSGDVVGPGIGELPPYLRAGAASRDHRRVASQASLRSGRHRRCRRPAVRPRRQLQPEAPGRRGHSCAASAGRPPRPSACLGPIDGLTSVGSSCVLTIRGVRTYDIGCSTALTSEPNRERMIGIRRRPGNPASCRSLSSITCHRWTRRHAASAAGHRRALKTQGLAATVCSAERTALDQYVEDSSFSNVTLGSSR